MKVFYPPSDKGNHIQLNFKNRIGGYNLPPFKDSEISKNLRPCEDSVAIPGLEHLPIRKNRVYGSNVTIPETYDQDLPEDSSYKFEVYQSGYLDSFIGNFPCHYIHNEKLRNVIIFLDDDTLIKYFFDQELGLKDVNGHYVRSILNALIISKDLSFILKSKSNRHGDLIWFGDVNVL
jgi:hypothetical protein